MNTGKMTAHQLNELEKTHIALETFVVQLEATIEVAEAGKIESCVEALKHLYGNAKRILDGDEPIDLNIQETARLVN